MIKLENIHSLTDFKRNAKELVEHIKATKSLVVLTVNGKAEVVVQDAIAFQEMVDRLQQVEDELKVLKLEQLKQDIAVGVEQLKNGDYTEYDETSLPTLLETIKARASHRLTQERSA
jgi:prevent-host-death family protein